MHPSCQAVDFKPAPGTYNRAHVRGTWIGGLGPHFWGILIDTGNYLWHAVEANAVRDDQYFYS